MQRGSSVEHPGTPGRWAGRHERRVTTRPGVFGPSSFLLDLEPMSERPGVRPHRVHEALCYHDCPSCGRRIDEPFIRGGPPVAYLHRRRGATCRVVIHPGTGGSIVEGESLESALLREAGRAA